MARLQARLAIGRLNATRLGDFLPALTVHINSLQAWRPGGAQGIVVDPSMTINEAMEDVPRTARFEMRDASSPPQQGQAAYIGLGSSSNRLFGGNIIRVRQTQSRYVDQPVWTVECEDNQRLLNRRLVTARFLSTDAADIIRVLVSSWTIGFTSTGVRGTLGNISEIEFTQERVSKAITRTCERIGAKWYLDAYNDVHAFTGEEGGVSGAAGIFATGKHWAWEHERDLSQIRTKVLVTGGGHASTSPYVTDSQFIYLDDTEYLTGATTISAGRYAYAATSINRTSAPWFVVFVPGIKEALPAGTMFNVYAVAQSTTLQNSVAAIEGGDGIHEYAVTDGRLTQTGAIQRAEAELTLYGAPEQRGSYVSRDPSAVIGRQLVINVASPTHVTSVSARIQRVKVGQFEESSRAWNSARTHLFPQRTVTYNTTAVRDIYQILGDYERGRT